jgi:hypothetical protein
MATKKKAKTTKLSTKTKSKAKKKTTAKKKITARKKPVTKAANPHAGKRFFKIELGGYGGELIVGKASQEFVEYWLDEDRKENLMEHMHAVSDIASFGTDEDYDIPEGYDGDSPEVYEGSGHREYWDFDDIEHDTMVSYEYGRYSVTEITVDPRAEYKDGELSWSDAATKKRNFDWGSRLYTEVEGSTKEYDHENNVVCRELYMHDSKEAAFKVCDADPIPAIMMYDSQKGTFGHVYVMTDGEDFDPKKFAYASLDNTMSNSIFMLFYDKQSLTVDNNELSTWGKGFFASVGYLPKCEVEYDLDEMLKAGWEDLELQ